MVPRQSQNPDEENHVLIFPLVAVRNHWFVSDFQAAMFPKTWIAVLVGATQVVAKDPYDYVRLRRIKNELN